MNWNQIEGQWLQMVGHVKTQWGKLTDDDIKVVAGKRDQLVGKVQERYGLLKEDAEKQVNEWSTKVATFAAKPADKPHDAKATDKPYDAKTPARPYDAKPGPKPSADGKPATR